MRTLPQEAARTGSEIWWPAGAPAGHDRPLMGRWPGGARAVMPLSDAGVTVGAMVICWPEPLPEFAAPLRRQLTALADLAAQTLGARFGEDGIAGDHSAAWVLGLLDGLVDGLLIAQAVRDAEGNVSDFLIEHVSTGFEDRAGRGRAELAGQHLLEMYPAAALAGGLFDRCAAVLATGEPQQVPGGALAWPDDEAGTGQVPAARIARVYDGVAISWRAADHADRLSALLGHAQRLGRIGGWEENLRTSEVHWTEATFALFGQPQGVAVPIGELNAWVPAEDMPAVTPRCAGPTRTSQPTTTPGWRSPPRASSSPTPRNAPGKSTGSRCGCSRRSRPEPPIRWPRPGWRSPPGTARPGRAPWSAVTGMTRYCCQPRRYCWSSATSPGTAWTPSPAWWRCATACAAWRSPAPALPRCSAG